MQDGPLRRAVKLVARLLGGLELAVRRHLSPGRYRLLGTCNACGQCCKSPARQLSRLAFFLPTVKASIIAWERLVNGWELRDQDRRLRVLVFHCTHYVEATKQCDSYSSRPLACRDYPRNLTFEAVPFLFEQCSHKVVDKRAAELKAELVAAGLKGKKLAEVSRKLFLDE